MPRDKEFQRKKKDTRMPVRDSHAEEQIGRASCRERV